jgi:Fur family ferric uptake transcriptional regulator
MDVHVSLPPEFIAQIERQTGVKITDYRIDFYGYKEEEGSTLNK